MRQQQRLTDEVVQQLIESYRGRGEMTRPEFCASRGMTLSRFDYYLRRHNQISKPIPRLAKVKVKPGAAERIGRYALVLANGRRIECEAAQLAKLIRIAESA